MGVSIVIFCFLISYLMKIKIPAPTTKMIPTSVLKVGMSLNKRYPIITDHIINEYSNIEVIEVEYVV